MKKRLLLVILLALLIFPIWGSDYTFEQIDVNVRIGLDNSYDITERIGANFFVPKHGIYREIPTRYGNQQIKLTNLFSSDPIIRDNVSSGWATFRLGDKNVTVTGFKEYLLSYTLEIGDDRNREGDFIYYNLLGPGWEEEIKNFTFSVTLPKAVDPKNVSVTGGRVGSTSLRGTFEISGDHKTITGSAQNLKPGEALTLYIELEEGYFSEVKKFVDLTLLLYGVVILLTLAFLSHSYLIWKRYGQDELFIPVVRFEPPEDLSPLEVGYLFDGVVDTKDLSSMLFYWADGGYIQIEELKKKQYRFIKLKELKTSKAHEEQLFYAFFDSGDGMSVTLKQLSSSTAFATKLQKTKDRTRAYFKKERELKDQNAERKRIIPMLYGIGALGFHSWATTYSDQSQTLFMLPLLGSLALLILTAIATPKILDSWMMLQKKKAVIKGIALLLLYLLFFGFTNSLYAFFLELGLVTSIIFSLTALAIPIIFALLGAITMKRSAYAQKVLEEIVGYREFIEKVEIDKLKMMVASDPELFYHVLGYAIVLGLENTWAKKFASIELTQATWYVGVGTAHRAIFYSSLASTLTQGAVAKPMYSQASSSSRGPIRPSFGGGGGFSGGGFGGGGGGAW
ncbi:MAG: DUF2207 domain-containing protein [Sphaerochaeta sp.]